MDLVTTYVSENDDSLDSVKTPASPKAAESSKTIDVIELDSDSDNDCVSSVEKNTSTVTPECTKELTKTSKQVDCIDIDDDDDQAIDSSNSKQNETQSVSSNKKVDYLNLEGSDSDDEGEVANKNLRTLKESASMLSSMPCGPQKPRELSGKDLKNTVSLNNANTSAKCSYYKDIPDFVGGKASCDNLESPGKKRFKGNTYIPSILQNEVGNSAFQKKDTSIYREDVKVVEASNKNAACRIPRQVTQTHEAHSSVVTSLCWCVQKYCYLFLSSSLDGSIKIWDLSEEKPVQYVKTMKGINAAKWSLDGGQIVAGGHGEKAFVFDVETGKEIVAYDIYNVVTSMEVHPYMEDVFLCGTRNAILGFDIRVNSTFPIRSYFSKCEEVLDIAFLDENEFICSTSIVSQDSSDRTIMAWDFSSGAILSNQIYLEHYTCPSLKVHPSESIFVAQSNGNYIVSFSASRPYKRKGKIYMGHKVSGYRIECDISPDGKYLASGDAEGEVYFYNFATASSVHNATAGKSNSTTPAGKPFATNRVRWHPVFSSTLITATYDGHIQIWK